MKLTAKRLLAWVLAAALVGGFLPVGGLTPSAKAAQKISGSQVEVNPLYEGVLTEQALLDRLEEQTPDGGSSDNRTGERSTVRNATYQTAEDLVDDVRDAMVKRKTKFTVYLKCSTSEDYKAVVKQIFHEALEETDASNEGDYLRWQYGGYNCGYDGETVGNEYRLALKYSLNYYTTAAQEKKVTQKVDEVLASMNFTDSTKASKKIRDIYDYICAHVTYDYPHLNDNSYVLQYTAYGALIDGKAVCQGYATLLYRMLRESGVSSRVITSTDHAWNIAQIGALYYNLDSTWDAGKSSYRYFLKGTSDFTGHVSEAQYLTKEFTSRYPIAPKAFQGDTSATPETETTALSSSMVELSAANYTYDGTAKKPAVTVKNGSKTLKVNTDYAVSYKNNTNAGTATVTVTGKGDYTGTVEKAFTISQATQKITATSSYKKTVGNAAFKLNAKTSGDGKLSYKSDNKKVATVSSAGKVTLKGVGKATITITAKATNNYKQATKKVTITVNPKGTTLSNLTNVTGKRLKVTWEKNTAVSNYEIQYGTSKTFKGAKTITADSSKTAETISKLTKGKTYYVRIRTCKTDSGKKYCYCSSWSASRKLNIAK